MLGVGVLPLIRAGLGAAAVPTVALTGVPPETVALPTVPVAGHRRIAAVWPKKPGGRSGGGGARRSGGRVPGDPVDAPPVI
ncbi:hypothetical protein [Streptomyces sp. NPDC006739]|uniref:hypothetical protein n=1 Tax=Streptomyces sp. NPDC006739 TaxID=3364763 RepID=UPI0036A2CDDF